MVYNNLFYYTKLLIDSKTNKSNRKRDREKRIKILQIRSVENDKSSSSDGADENSPQHIVSHFTLYWLIINNALSYFHL